MTTRPHGPFGHRAAPLLIAAVVVAACGGTPATTEAASTTSTPGSTTSVATTATTATTVPTTGVLSGFAFSDELATALAGVSATPCGTGRATPLLVSLLGDQDPLFESQGVVVSGEEEQPYSSAPADVRRIHTLLYLNFNRIEWAIPAFLEAPIEPVIFYDNFFLLDNDHVAARWDGQVITFGDEEPEPLDAFGFLRTPPRELAVGSEAYEEAWLIAEDWIGDLAEVVESMDPGRLPELKELALNLETISNIGCVLLGTEWVAADAAIAGQSLAWMADHQEVFYGELAAHQLLLITELMEVLVDYMERPEIDWLEGDGVVMEDSLDGVTSSSEYLFYWHASIFYSLPALRALRPAGVG